MLAVLPVLAVQEDVEVVPVPVVKGAGMETVTDYWPEAAQDLSVVQWSHATNSRELLQTALEDTTMMIGADVALGNSSLPIMANSSFTFENFLETVVLAIETKGVKKGIKLFFPTLDVLQPSLEILASFKDRIVFPVLLHADILLGPGGGSAQVDPEQFLKMCAEGLPGASLSVGWTTGPKGKYETSQLGPMVDLLVKSNLTVPVTLALRASLITRSDVPSLSGFLIKAENAGVFPTVTVWDGAEDSVDREELDEFVELVGKNRVYLDVPWATGKGSGGATLNLLVAILCLLPCLLN